jgi:hypothetical protein
MRIPCPLEDNEDYYIEIPNVWLGSHYLTWLEAMEASKDAKGVLKRFAVSITICDNYNLPGLTGKHEEWDLTKCPLRLMNWVVSEVLANDVHGFEACFTIPKKKPLNTGALLNLMATVGASQKAA